MGCTESKQENEMQESVSRRTTREPCDNLGAGTQLRGYAPCAGESRWRPFPRQWKEREGNGPETHITGRINKKWQLSR